MGKRFYQKFGTMMCKFFDLYYLEANLSCPKSRKRQPRMGRTLKDSFVNLIEYVTYRQEKDREFCVLCPFI